MGKARTQWVGVFRIYNADTGELVAENTILADGIEMTLALWAGDTDEAFGSLRVEDTNKATIAEKTVDITYTVDETGADPRGELQSRALFRAADVTAEVHHVSLVGTLNTVIARAALDTPLAADQAYEIKRTDYLAEAAEVAP